MERISPVEFLNNKKLSQKHNNTHSSVLVLSDIFINDLSLKADYANRLSDHKARKQSIKQMKTLQEAMKQ